MQAFLITAYKDQKQLLRLISAVNKIGKVFVHIDEKSSEIDMNYMQSLNLDNTVFVSNYSIYWGSFNHVRAIFDLIELALKDEKIHYMHTISGQDYPVKGAEEFLNYFSEECRAVHMSCSDDQVYDTGVIDRYKYWYPMTRQNPQALLTRALNRLFVSLQEVFRISRDSIGDYTKIYKGMIYVSAPRKVMEYVSDCFRNDRKLYKCLSHTRLAEEFVFQTILMNSEFAKYVNGNNLRYNDWEHGEGGSPAVIDENNYESIVNGNYFFMRKVASGISDILIDKF